MFRDRIYIYILITSSCLDFQFIFNITGLFLNFINFTFICLLSLVVLGVELRVFNFLDRQALYHLLQLLHCPNLYDFYPEKP
jgi:hypothetical protein